MKAYNLEQLNKLIARRTNKVKLMQEDGDNSHSTLANLYGDSTHFITELLQNAEDEGAKNVEFILTQNSLEFSHDSKNYFDFNDIRAISNFGDNKEKKEKPNAIGRFGIGFKSVYSITDQPRIISGEFDITIHEYNIPVPTDNTDHTFLKGTRIILPFKKEIRQKTFELLKRELEDLNLEYLLFLSSISTIKFNSFIYERLRDRKNKLFISVRSDIKENKYILLEKQITIHKKKLQIKIAFLLNEKRKIVPCNKSPLFVFFPTKTETNLKFLVHAPFYTTPARENLQDNENLINIEDDKRNDQLKTEIGRLLSESLPIFKEMNILNVEFLSILPIKSSECSRSSIYEELYKATKKEFSSNKRFIPTNVKGVFSSAKDSMLLGSAELAELVDVNQTKLLFGRHSWIDKGVTKDKAKDLRDYFHTDLSIPEYDLASFISKISESFLALQKDSWMIQFYQVIHKAPALWRSAVKNSSIRYKPIIRIETKGKRKHVPPFQDDGKPNVFLPNQNNSQYTTVKRNIVANKKARKFLEDLGLKQPDLLDEIDEFVIPRFTGKVYPEYFDDFKKIIKVFQSINQDKKDSLIQRLQKQSFILGINFETKETKLVKHDTLYFQTPDLRTFFFNNNAIFFVAEEQYKFSRATQKHFKKFLVDLGIMGYPKKLLLINNSLSTEEKTKLREKSDLPSKTWDKVNDYDLEGLKFFFSKINYEKSLALWNILSFVPNDYFLGKYEWTNYASYVRTKSFEAKFVNDLKVNKWIYDKSKNLASPKEINYNQLANDYQNSIISTLLDFKPDEITEIEKRNDGKFISREEYAEFKKWKLQNANEGKSDEQQNDEDDGNMEFVPECKPEEARLNSRILEESKVRVNFQHGEGNIAASNLGEDNKETGSDFDDPNDQLKQRPNQKTLNAIGDWGEAYVELELNKEFENDPLIKIINQNKNGKTGVGCDFTVEKNNQTIRIIEVKSTVEKFGKALIISGTQWELARHFFNLTEGDKYWIYCVFNTGQVNSEIVKLKNPIQMWKDGKLQADSVSFIVR